MSLKHLFLAPALLLAACTANTDTSTDSSMDSHSEATSVSSVNTALDRLNNSPRHHEWMEVDNNGKTVHTFVAYPERSDSAPVVILIHENRGLNDWARSMADQIAEAGYIAVAPDLLSGYSEEFEQTSDFPNEDAARTALGELDPMQVQADLQAVADWAKTIPSSNGQLVSAGFCWGGAQSYEFATKSDDLTAAMVFYGTGPTDAAAYADIDVPVYGFYGGADERVNATIPQSEQYMTSANKTFEYEIYEGAGHAFMRSGEEPDADPANKAARDAAFERMKEILEGLE